jgi:hypothetical protein
MDAIENYSSFDLHGIHLTLGHKTLRPYRRTQPIQNSYHQLNLDVNLVKPAQVVLQILVLHLHQVDPTFPCTF